jgi:hypothetical protein
VYIGYVETISISEIYVVSVDVYFAPMWGLNHSPPTVMVSKVVTDANAYLYFHSEFDNDLLLTLKKWERSGKFYIVCSYSQPLPKTFHLDSSTTWYTLLLYLVLYLNVSVAAFP